MKYYEVEKPEIITSQKNVVKVYKEQGKIQVFPRVPNSKHGIGRGATIDFETMTKDQISILMKLVGETVQNQLSKENHFTC